MSAYPFRAATGRSTVQIRDGQEKGGGASWAALQVSGLIEASAVAYDMIDSVFDLSDNNPEICHITLRPSTRLRSSANAIIAAWFPLLGRRSFKIPAFCRS